jgi:hypothetical protein
MIKWHEGITEQEFTDAINDAVINALKDGVNAKPPIADYKDYVKAHLKFWAESGVAAPGNELQSIQAWLRYSSNHSKEEIQDTWRTRMTLLMKAAQEVYDGGQAEEDRIGIYDNRPDMDRGR